MRIRSIGAGMRRVGWILRAGGRGGGGGGGGAVVLGGAWALM